MAKILLNNKNITTVSLLKRFFILLMFLFSGFVAPSFTVSACDPTTDPNCKPDSTTINTQQPDSSTVNGVKVTTGITNPISGVEDIPQLIEAILNFVLIIGVPIVALAIIYSGFLFVTAQGNSEKLTTAKKTLLYTLIGAALLLGCLVITKAIKGTVDCLGTDTVTCK